jgi:hypothetical protein
VWATNRSIKFFIFLAVISERKHADRHDLGIIRPFYAICANDSSNVMVWALLFHLFHNNYILCVSSNTKPFLKYCVKWPTRTKAGDAQRERKIQIAAFRVLYLYLILNTNNLLHVNTTFTQYTTNTIFKRNTNNTTTRASVQEVTEADWLTRSRGSKREEAFKTQPPSFVSRILAPYKGLIV